MGWDLTLMAGEGVMAHQVAEMPSMPEKDAIRIAFQDAEMKNPRSVQEGLALFTLWVQDQPWDAKVKLNHVRDAETTIAIFKDHGVRWELV